MSEHNKQLDEVNLARIKKAVGKFFSKGAKTASKGGEKVEPKVDMPGTPHASGAASKTTRTSNRPVRNGLGVARKEKNADVWRDDNWNFKSTKTVAKRADIKNSDVGKKVLDKAAKRGFTSAPAKASAAAPKAAAKSDYVPPMKKGATGKFEKNPDYVAAKKPSAAPKTTTAAKPTVKQGKGGKFQSLKNEPKMPKAAQLEVPKNQMKLPSEAPKIPAPDKPKSAPSTKKASGTTTPTHKTNADQASASKTIDNFQANKGMPVKKTSAGSNAGRAAATVGATAAVASTATNKSEPAKPATTSAASTSASVPSPKSSTTPKVNRPTAAAAPKATPSVPKTKPAAPTSDDLKPAGGAQAAPKPSTSYTVKSGDSLWKIASAKLGKGASNADINNYTKKLYSKNKGIIGKNANLIKPGQKLSY